jgi:hypothetical protein
MSRSSARQNDGEPRRAMGVRAGGGTVFLFAMCLSCCNALFAQDESGNEPESRIKDVFQDLFLGELVYPQDRGSLQFSTGLYWANEGKDDFELPLVFQYGITDYFQIGALLPVDFARTGPLDAEGLGSVEFEAYYNYFNDPRSGRAYGVGFGVALPTATPEVSDRSFVYSPFFVAYREFDALHVNVSAGIEIEDYLSDRKKTDVGGNVEAAVFEQFGQFIPVVEIGLDDDPDGTFLRLAPELIWQPRANVEWGVALPIGLTEDTPALGVYTLLTIEFGGESPAKSPKRAPQPRDARGVKDAIWPSNRN